MLRIKPFAFFVLVIFLGVFSGYAQVNKPIITYLDSEFKEVADAKSATYKEERWHDKGVWKAKALNIHSELKVVEYEFADSTRNYKKGMAIYYGVNGKRIGFEHYENGVKNGPFTYSSLDGNPTRKGQYKNGKLVDTITTYNNEGKVKALYFLNNEGNGTGQEFFTKVGVTGEGKVENGKQSGPWMYKNKAGKKVMEVVYDEKGIGAETCFGPDEKPMGGECISDRPAQFPGGEDAWRRYLEKNIKYPKSARKEGTEGLVCLKFNVATDGSISNIRVLVSPSDDLAAEATRILEKSPNWIPAHEVNKPVSYPFIQSLTFRLQ